MEVEKDWVPEGPGTSLYVRPVLIGNEVSLAQGREGAGVEGGGQAWTSSHSHCPPFPSQPSLGVGCVSKALLFVILCPVGSYFPGDSLTPVSLLADPAFIRAWIGGVGDYKLGG